MSTINKLLNYFVYLNSNFVDPNISYVLYRPAFRLPAAFEYTVIFQRMLHTRGTHRCQEAAWNMPLSGGRTLQQFLELETFI